MPSISDYWSDASCPEEEDSEEEEEEELYGPRELDYWAIEAYQDKRGPPPIISYVEKFNSFRLRECVIGPIRKDIESVVRLADSYSWQAFWNNTQGTSSSFFRYEDWDALGEFCFSLCECCNIEVDMDRVRSCMINILSYGKFKKCY